METGKVILGTLAGIAIGAALGVLLAPDKGSETRRKISQKGSDLTGGLKDKYSGLKDKYNDLVDNVTSKLESFTDGESGGNSGAQGKTAGAGAGAGAGSNMGR
ncbi:MAG: YtxH domain-containing protein [Flavobacterium sp.]|nr:MAG: YtxH domain-containing protein [Flavobacterium sp.]